MTKLRVAAFSISLDGFGAGLDQTLQTPLGVGGMKLHEWLIPTKAFQTTVIGQDRGSTGADNDFGVRSFENIGASIMGRNMFGPIRGEWPDETWKGWWGDNPPYHCDVFVLTHHPRKSLTMEGGTTFHFITDGIHVAWDKAKAAAKGKDIRLSGGVATIREYLKAGLVDEMHLAVSPVILGKGEHLLQGIDLAALGLEQTQYVPTQAAAHYVLTRKS